jgi:hypothetical protein
VGNPYPSAIDWDVAGWTKTNISGTIYVFDGTQYRTWNGTNGSLSQGIIPAMQGFMVKANNFNPVLQVSNSARRHNRAPYKSDEQLTNLLVINIDGNGYSDMTHIHFNSEATPEFDNAFDGYKLPGIDEAPQIYTLAGDLKLSINELPEIYDGLSIPLCIKTGSAGEYTIHVEGIESLETNLKVQLIDLIDDRTIELSSQSSFNIASSPSDPSERFILQFGVLGVNEGSELFAWNIFSDDNKIFISNPEKISGAQLSVTDITGREILSQSLPSDLSIEVNLKVEQGYYISTITNGNHVISEKLFIK